MHMHYINRTMCVHKSNKYNNFMCMYAYDYVRKKCRLYKIDLLESYLTKDVIIFILFLDIQLQWKLSSKFMKLMVYIQSAVHNVSLGCSSFISIFCAVPYMFICIWLALNDISQAIKAIALPWCYKNEFPHAR